VAWDAPLIASEVDAHPELLSIPTFVLFVQKDELQMSRAEVRKEDRLEAQKEFEAWLAHQTAPRQAPPKKQMQNEESLAPVDDKERSAVAVRTAAAAAAQAGGPKGISRPSSDGFRPRAGGQLRPPAPQPRAWNSQRGVRAVATEAASPPRSRATTMADTIAANSNPDPGYVKDMPPGAAIGGRSPTRKTPTPRPGSNGRPKTPTPRPGSNGRPPNRRPPSARKENGNRSNAMRPSSAGMGSARPQGSGMGSARMQNGAKRKTPRATPRRDRPPSAPVQMVHG
jgi:hypothetical protein